MASYLYNLTDADATAALPAMQAVNHGAFGVDRYGMYGGNGLNQGFALCSVVALHGVR